MTLPQVATLHPRWFVLLLATALLCAGCSRKTAIPSGTIVFLGDSITAGYGLPPEQAYPALISIPGMTMENLGVSGSKTEDGVRRLKEYFESHESPRLVVIALGGNDIIQNVSADQTEEHLNDMIEICRRQGVAVLLCGIHVPGKFEPQETFSRVANKNRVPFYPDFVQGEFMEEKYLQDDHVHPNGEGQARLAGAMRQALLDHFVFGGK